ncbi:hypothetical protein ACJX0J_008561, partial [Zea mays]
FSLVSAINQLRIQSITRTLHQRRQIHHKGRSTANFLLQLNLKIYRGVDTNISHIGHSQYLFTILHILNFIMIGSKYPLELIFFDVWAPIVSREFEALTCFLKNNLCFQSTQVNHNIYDEIQAISTIQYV